jgi:Fe2+ transport system protein FeoA
MKVAEQPMTADRDTPLVPLSHLRAGQEGSVGGVLGTHEIVHRLREMGLHDGARVQMIRPGNSCIINLRGQRLGFRMDDCAHVMIALQATGS